MLKEIKGDLNKRRDILCSYVVKLNIVKMSVLVIYRFNTILFKLSAGFFVVVTIEIDKIIPKFLCKSKGPGIAKTTLKRKIGRFTTINFKTHYKVIVFKRM